MSKQDRVRSGVAMGAAMLVCALSSVACTSRGAVAQAAEAADPPLAVASALPDARDQSARSAHESADKMVTDGRQIFRFDTFGDEAFWGGQILLHQAVATLSPRVALSLGLKVDADALPHRVLAAIRAGNVDLDDPNVTLALVKDNAVLGVKGIFGTQGQLSSIGLTCALCHSTVDDSVASGIGRRIDGLANRDLNVGAIVAAGPNLAPFVDLLKLGNPSIDAAQVRAVLNSWGPGKFDA